MKFAVCNSILITYKYKNFITSCTHFVFPLDMLLFFDPHFSGKFEHHKNFDEELPAMHYGEMKATSRQIGG